MKSSSDFFFFPLFIQGTKSKGRFKQNLKANLNVLFQGKDSVKGIINLQGVCSDLNILKVAYKGLIIN